MYGKNNRILYSAMFSQGFKVVAAKEASNQLLGRSACGLRGEFLWGLSALRWIARIRVFLTKR
jgi:hypothetical protein